MKKKISGEIKPSVEKVVKNGRALYKYSLNGFVLHTAADFYKYGLAVVLSDWPRGVRLDLPVLTNTVGKAKKAMSNWYLQPEIDQLRYEIVEFKLEQ